MTTDVPRNPPRFVTSEEAAAVRTPADVYGRMARLAYLAFAQAQVAGHVDDPDSAAEADPWAEVRRVKTMRQMLDVVIVAGDGRRRWEQRSRARVEIPAWNPTTAPASSVGEAPDDGGVGGGRGDGHHG